MRILKIQKISGFTFFEVVAVLLLIGIFTTVAIVQHTRTDPTLIVQSHVLQSHIRYAQMRSMNSDVKWGIVYDQNAGHYEIYSGHSGNTADLPGETENRVRLSEMGIAIGAAVGGAPFSSSDFEISFDSWGQPHMNASDAPVANPIILNLTKSGQKPAQLTIIEHTGFIR